MARRGSGPLGFLLLGLVLAASPASAGGARAYAQHCAVCHQPEGQGVPGLYPKLAGRASRYLGVDGGRAYLVRVPAFGLTGPVPEDQIVLGFMPAFSQLSNEDIAEIVNYLVTGLQGDAFPLSDPPLTAGEVAVIRGKRLSPAEVGTERQRLVEALRRAAAGAGPMPRITGAAEDYARNCQGCHLADGRGIPGLVPNLVGFVGYFTRLPEGRAFLVRVPGVAQAPLDDERLAAVLNWTLQRFSPRQLAPDFQPFTAGEIGRYRADILTSVTRARESLVTRLKERGVLP